MNKPDEKYVYHGSWELFETAIPKKQKRGKMLKSGEIKTIYDDISFHATPYKWVALAYTDDQSHYKVINGKKAYYNKGVDLYKYTETVDIFGFNSLEESLEKIYGKGGYLFTFEKDKFFHVKGLGNFEVISKENVKHLKTERIEDPVAELRNLGITFNFIDLARPENEKFR